MLQKTYSPTELLHLVTGYMRKVYVTYYVDGFDVNGAFSFSYQLWSCDYCVLLTVRQTLFTVFNSQVEYFVH